VYAPLFTHYASCITFQKYFSPQVFLRKRRLTSQQHRERYNVTLIIMMSGKRASYREQGEHSMKTLKTVFIILAGCALLAACSSKSTDITGVNTEDMTNETASTRLAALTPAGGGNLYVATWGNDSNSGDSSSPWLTLQHAVEQVQPGDTIWIESGTYTGFTATVSGQAGATITMKPVSGATVTIDSTSPYNQYGDNVELNGVSYWSLEGLRVTGARRYGIHVAGSSSNFAQSVTLSNNTIANSGLSGIYMIYVDYAVIEGNISSNNGKAGIHLKYDGDYAVVRSNITRNNVGTGIQINGATPSAGDGIISYATVEDNVLSGNCQDGRGGALNIERVSNSTISDNTIRKNGSDGIMLYNYAGGMCATDNTIRDNTVYVPSSSNGWALTLSHTDCTGNTVRNNVLISRNANAGSIRIPTADLAGFVSDRNQVVNRFSYNGGRTIVDLSAWQALGYDQNSSL